MFLPIGDQPNPPGTPVVNYTLIAINVVVYVLVSLPLMTQAADPADPRFQEYIRVIGQNLPANVPLDQIARQISAYDLFVFSYGYRPAEPSLVALFTAMFLHGSFMHLAGNMLFLWIYGDNVEHRLGRLPYLMGYLTTGVAATLFHAVFASDSPIPLVGASGAISGVLGFYFIWFPHNQVRILYWFFIINVIVLPARWVLGFYIFIDNILPFLASGGQGSGIAHGAHIGGFLAGLAAAAFMDRKKVSGRAEDYRVPEQASSPFSAPGPPPPPPESLSDVIRRGDLDRAANLYFQLPTGGTRGALTPEESMTLGNWLAQNGHSRAALTLYQRHIRDFPNGPYLAEAHAYAGMVQLHAFDEPTAAYQHLMEALELHPSPELETLIRNGLASIQSRSRGRKPPWR